MSDTINRNDLAAIAVMKKIVDRLAKKKAEHEERVAAHHAQVQLIRHALTQMNPHSTQLNQQTLNSQLNAMSNAQYAAMYGSHSHTISYNQPSLAAMMEWVPYLTAQEYAVLEAWANGDDVLVHLLSRE